MESCPEEGVVGSLHKRRPSPGLRERSKSFDDISLDMKGNCASSSKGTVCLSNQSSPVGTLTSAPPAFSHCDQPENSCNDISVARLQFGERKSYVESMPSIGLVDGVESSRDSKQLNLEKVTEQSSLVKPCPSEVGTISELESKAALTEDVSKVS